MVDAFDLKFELRAGLLRTYASVLDDNFVRSQLETPSGFLIYQIGPEIWLGVVAAVQGFLLNSTEDGESFAGSRSR